MKVLLGEKGSGRQLGLSWRHDEETNYKIGDKVAYGDIEVAIDEIEIMQHYIILYIEI